MFLHVPILQLNEYNTKYPPRGGARVANDAVTLKPFGVARCANIPHITRLFNIPPRGVRGGCHEVTGGVGGGSWDGIARSAYHSEAVYIITAKLCISSLRRCV